MTRTPNKTLPVTGREVLLVILGFLALTTAYFRPMIQDPDRVWSVGRDYYQNTWNLWWVDHAWENEQPVYETDMLFHPTGTSLSMHTLSLANTVPGTALQQGLGLSVGTTHTVLFLFAFVASGLAAWGLARYVSGAPVGAFAAGVFFAFQPYHTSMVTQLNNAPLQWFPLVMLGVLWLYDRGRPAAILLTGVALALAGYTDWYQPVLCVIGGGTVVLFRMARDGRLGDGKLWAKILGVGLIAGILMYPGAAPLIERLGETGGDSELAEPIRYVGETQLLGMRPNGLEQHFFWPVLLGYTTLLVLVWTALRVRDKGIGAWWALAGVSFLLLQGPHLVVLNHEFESIPMPMALFQHVPVLDMIRVPHRFLALLGLGVAGLMAFGLREWRIQRGMFQTALLIPLLALELMPAWTEPVRLQTAPAYQAMAEDESDFAVLELPLDYRDGYPMYLQTRHQKPLVAGYTSHIMPEALTSLRTELMRALHPAETDNDVLGLPEHLPVDVDALTQGRVDEWRRELLWGLNVRFIVFREEPDFVGMERPSPPKGFGEELRASLLPFSMNPVMRQSAAYRRQAVRNYRAGLTEHSAQALELVKRLFGEPDTELSNSGTKVWDLRPWAEREPAAANRR